MRAKRGWDGQEEGLAVSIKQEFVEPVDKSQPGTASCLSNASAGTLWRETQDTCKDWHLQKTSAPIPNGLEQHCRGCSDMSHSQDALAAIFS